jgi:hypothetical protein
MRFDCRRGDEIQYSDFLSKVQWGWTLIGRLGRGMSDLPLTHPRFMRGMLCIQTRLSYQAPREHALEIGG